MASGPQGLCVCARSKGMRRAKTWCVCTSHIYIIWGESNCVYTKNVRRGGSRWAQNPVYTISNGIFLHTHLEHKSFSSYFTGENTIFIPRLRKHAQYEGFRCCDFQGFRGPRYPVSPILNGVFRPTNFGKACFTW